MMQRRMRHLAGITILFLLFSSLFVGPATSAPDKKPKSQTERKEQQGPGNGNGHARGQTSSSATTSGSIDVTSTTTASATTIAPTTTSASTTTSSSTTTAPAIDPTTTLAPTTTASSPTTTGATNTTTTTTGLPTTTTSSTTTTTTIGPVDWVSPEGVTIRIDSDGAWTVDQVYQMLLANALDLDLIGPTLTIHVQDVYASSASTSASSSGGVYNSFNAILYLEGVDSSFVNTPDAILAHEYGHVWSMYHYYLSQGGMWDGYLAARDLTDDSRLNSSYRWTLTEIIADDYKLLFGSPETLAQRPNHMNWEIPHPSDVPGLYDYLLSEWTSP